MLRFEFTTLSKRGLDDGSLCITVAEPLPVEEFPDNYACKIQFVGIVNKDMRAVGAFPLQAVDLALQIAKAVAGSYTNEWDFYADGQGPLPFDY